MTKTQYNMDNYGVSWFKFNEAVPTSIIDSKGSNTATVTGTSIVASASGSARSFNGTSDFIRFNTSVIPVGAKSIRFKFKAPVDLPNKDTYLMINLSSYASQHGMGVQIHPSTGKLSFANAAGTQGFRFWIQSPTSVCDNQWHDILFTWDGTTTPNAVQLYVDDMRNPAATTTSQLSDATAYAEVLQIGRLSNTSYYARFDLDELEIYNAVINPFEDKILLSSGDKNYCLENVISRENAVPVMTSPSNINAEVTASAYNASDYPWYAFDGLVNATARPFWYTNSAPPAGGHWLQIKFGKPKFVSGISLAALLITGSSYSIKEFELYGSNDGTVYEKLYTNTQLNVGTKIYYDFENSKAYSYYRLNILSSYHLVTTVGVSEMEIFQKSNQTMYVLDASDESSFNQYGMKSDISFNEAVDKIKDVIKTNLPFGSGKTFEHLIDMSKRRVDKITLS